jgi:hypothetical protein
MNPLILTSSAYLLAVGMCVLALLRKGKYEQWLAVIEQRFSTLAARPFLAAIGLFLAVFLLRAAALSILPLPTPGAHDEFSYLLLSDTFAHGRLTNPTPPLWQSFETFHELFSPTYCSKYPPAQGAVLAIGQLLGNPWFGVLLSAAAMAAILLWALRAWMPARWAFLAAVLVAAKLCFTSYWVNSFWGGAPAAIGGALAIGGLGRILRRPSVGSTILLGVGISILANSRPYEGGAFCLPIAAVLFWWAIGKTKSQANWRDRFRKVILPLSVVLVANFAFMGYYNWRLTGNARTMPLSLYEQRYNPGAIFIWQSPRPYIQQDNHQFDDFYNRWVRGLYKPTWKDLKRITWKKAQLVSATFLWWDLILVVPALYFLAKRRKLLVLWAPFVFTCLAYLLLAWILPHYIAPALCVVFAMIVTGMRHLRLFQPRGMALGLFFSRLIVIGLFLQTANAVVTGNEDPIGIGGVRMEERAALVQRLNAMPGKHLVFVHYSAKHNVHDEWVYNSADIATSKIVWARELDEQQNRKLVEYYKDRQAWIIEADRMMPPLRSYFPGNN